MKSLVFILISLIMFFGTLFFVWKIVSNSNNSCLEINCGKESKYFISGDNYYLCNCTSVNPTEEICFKTESQAIEAGYKKGECR